MNAHIMAHAENGDSITVETKTNEEGEYKVLTIGYTVSIFMSEEKYKELKEEIIK